MGRTSEDISAIHIPNRQFPLSVALGAEFSCITVEERIGIWGKILSFLQCGVELNSVIFCLLQRHDCNLQHVLCLMLWIIRLKRGGEENVQALLWPYAILLCTLHGF